MSWNGERVLVTGGCGFIGSNLVDKLVELGAKVEVLDDYSTGKHENASATYFRMDISRPISDPHLHSDYKTIFHLAAKARIQPSFNNPKHVHDVNVSGTVQILEIARRNSTKVVFAGSSSVYHDIFANPYSFSKHIGEKYCKMYNWLYNVPVSIARFFNVYGPRQIEEGEYATVIGIFEKQRREDRPLTVTGDGLKCRDFTHVNDIVTGLLAMAETNCPATDIFNLGTGTNHSILEVAQMFGGPIEFIPARPGEAQVTLADASLALEKLGWSAKEKLPDYIKAFCSDI